MNFGLTGPLGKFASRADGLPLTAVMHLNDELGSLQELRPTWRNAFAHISLGKLSAGDAAAAVLVDGQLRALQPAWIRWAQSILQSARLERAKGGPDGSGPPLGRRRGWPPKRPFRSARGFDQSCGVEDAPTTAPVPPPTAAPTAAPGAHPIGSVTIHPIAAPMPAPVAPPAKARAPGSACQLPSRS
jgi:hypothetical protein